MSDPNPDDQPRSGRLTMSARLFGRPLSSQRRWLGGVPLMVVGLLIWVSTLGVPGGNQATSYAPPWVLALAGAFFFLLGLMFLAQGRRRLVQLLGILCAASIIGAVLGGLFAAASERPAGGAVIRPGGMTITGDLSLACLCLTGVAMFAGAAVAAIRIVRDRV